MKLREEEFYEQYHHHGGTTIIPTEIFNELYDDATEEIERLEQGYCELKEKCNKGECDCTHEEYNQMCEENIKLDLEIERLNNIIYNLEDKLNKLIEEQLEQYNKREENWEERKGVSNTWLTSRDCYYSILKYLQKLKGSDKE